MITAFNEARWNLCVGPCKIFNAAEVIFFHYMRVDRRRGQRGGGTTVDEEEEPIVECETPVTALAMDGCKRSGRW